MNNIDNFYWLFSSAAQSVAAMIAFLLAGVTLAFSMMDRLVERDPTLYEVTEGLKGRQHKVMSALVIVSGLTIILSLISTFINPFGLQLRIIIFVVTAFLIFTSIGGAVYFVIMVVSPNRYLNEAKLEIEKLTQLDVAGAHQQNANVFFHKFLDLEQDIRAFLREYELYIPSRGEVRMSFSFRQMIEALYQNQIIDVKLRDSLLEVNKLRNLIFHGHLKDVPQNMIDKLTEIDAFWRKVRSEQKK